MWTLSPSDAMTDPLTDSVLSDTTSLSHPNLHTVIEWLDVPPPSGAADDLHALHRQLAILRACIASPQQHATTLERLFTRSIATIHVLRSSLIGGTLPVSRKVRQLIRSQHDLLRTLAEDLLAARNDVETHLIHGLRQPEELVLWRCLYALAQHLLISDLTASPAGVGIWQQLHQIYQTAICLNLANTTPEDVSCSVHTLYFSVVLLGCAQPASFTSNEIDFVAQYLNRFADQVDPEDRNKPADVNGFWIDPASDAPPVASARKAPPPGTSVHCFSCNRLAALLKEQLAALEVGTSPAHLDLPEFAGTSAGHGVMRRLITHWGEPGKRRFPRRRQHYRAELCAGLDKLWHLFQDRDRAHAETSHWMITSESPDGYTAMHVSGKTGLLSAGDIAAIRTESGQRWQICIVRWALSENQEHLELGLQILATRAMPAYLVVPASPEVVRLPVLILPGIKVLGSSEMLVAASGKLENHSETLVLVIEKENIEIREVRSTALDEQNSRIEVFSIEPVTFSD